METAPVNTAGEADAAPGLGTGRLDHVLTPDDPAFPRSVLLCEDPPAVLYARGDLSTLQRPMVAIVGTRDPSPYGIEVAYRAAYECARAGLVVVSGLARGLDGRAHRGALDAGGTTIAVLGTGLDVPYPKLNLDLLESIPRQGLLLTEFPGGTPPAAWTFPRRNRLIAALARACLIVEGRANGGTSNTVEWLTRLGRTILAVPGRITDRMAEGPNNLIKNGAHPYLGPDDLLQEYGMRWEGESSRPGDGLGSGATPEEPRRLPRDGGASAAAHEARSRLQGAEALLFDLIGLEPIHVDQLADRSSLSPSLLLAALSSLEIQGLIRQLPGKRFALNT
jgi:DNA processing protein